MDLQDVVAILVAVAAAAWLARTLLRSAVSPACGPRADLPPGADGFVPCEGLGPVAKDRAAEHR